MNKDTVQGNIDQLMGKAKQKWAKLGDTDFELLAKGKVQEFKGKAQEAYGKTSEEVEKDIKDIEKSCGCSFSGKAA